MTEAKKIGLEETMDVVEFLESVVADLKKKREGGKEFSTSGVFVTMLSASPAAVRAIAGSGKIQQELSDLDQEEQEMLVKRSVKLMVDLVRIYSPDFVKDFK